MEVFLVLFIIGIIGAYIWAFTFRKEMPLFFEQELQKTGLNTNQKYTNVSGALAIDESSKKICLLKSTGSKRYETHIFPYKDLINSEILENGKTTSIGLNDGGLILARSKKKITSIVLKLTIDDTSNPVLNLNFYPSESLFKAQKSIEHWHGLMSVILSKHKNKKVDDNKTSTKNMNSDLENLEKLASLKEKGIISEDEFLAKKKQILGL